MAQPDLKIFVSEDGSLVNLYHLLGVESDAEENAIKTAYRKKMLLCHPDKVPNNPNATDLCYRITKACDILLDKETRKVYDEQLQIKNKEDVKITIKIKNQNFCNQRQQESNTLHFPLSPKNHINNKQHFEENPTFLLTCGGILTIIFVNLILVIILVAYMIQQSAGGTSSPLESSVKYPGAPIGIHDA